MSNVFSSVVRQGTIITASEDAENKPGRPDEVACHHFKGKQLPLMIDGEE